MPTTTPNPTAVPAGFDPVLHLRYRLFLPSLLSLPVMAVYDALRGYVWREANYGPESLTVKVLNGVLAAQPTQNQLAAITGLARETVNRCLRRLERLGWIIPDATIGAGQAKVYDLGMAHRDSAGDAEVFYADSMMVKLYEDVDARARRDRKTTFRRLPAERQKLLVSEALSLTPRTPTLRRQLSERTGALLMVPATFHLAATLATLRGLQKTHLQSQSLFEAGCDPELSAGLDQGEMPVGSGENLPFIRQKQPVTQDDMGGEGVILQHNPCEAGSQADDSKTASNPLILKQIGESASATIHSINIQPLTTFGSCLRTTYSDSSLHSVGEPPGSQAHLSGMTQRRGDGLPLASSPSPVPRAPSPVTDPAGRVTPLRDCPKEAAPVPAQPPKTPWTGLDPDEHPNDAPVAVSGHRPSALEDVTRIVEAAKLRSREALTAKVERLRSKERKSTNLSSDRAVRGQKSAAMRLEHVWKAEMTAAFPGIPQIAWFKQERGKVLPRKEGKLAADLLDGYGGDEAVVTQLVETFVRCWGELGPMLTKQDDSVPTFGLLYACHATVAAEMPRLLKKMDIVARYESWRAANAGNDFAVPPTDLEAAYKALTAKKGRR